MATSAFKSTSKRSSFPSNDADAAASSSSSSKSNRSGGMHRRSRSLSRFSSRVLDAESDETRAPRGRFVNTVRGSGFPEVSLADLANDLFPSKNTKEDQNERGRSSRRNSTIAPSQSRARSVSRQRSRAGDAKAGSFDNNASSSSSTSRGKPLTTNNNTSRRRRSLSVAPNCQFSDSESDMDPLNNSDNYTNISRNNWRPSVHKPTAPNHQRALSRSLSHKELSKLHDGYSSHSSALTDDDARDNHSDKDGIGRTTQAVYVQKKTGNPSGDATDTGLYKAMRKELRYAVEEMRSELEQVMVNTKSPGLANSDCIQSNDLDVLQAVALIRKNYTTKLEQSEKRKQDLLAEIVFEEQRGQELSKIVQELLPDTRNTFVTETPSHTRTRSSDRNKISRHLTEEAEKYFEDFLSNVEDTDISSVDGEKSDASSKFGGRIKLRDHAMHCVGTENFCIPETSTSPSVEMDGVILPWLQWDTSNNESPSWCNNTAEVPATSQNDAHDTLQGASGSYSKSNCFTSSHGSWSPSDDSLSVVSREDTGSRYSSHCVANRTKTSDIDDYLYVQHNEDLIFECWRQRLRRDSGGLILCDGAFL